MGFDLPELEVHMIVTTPYKTLSHITANKKYVIRKVEQDIIWLENDYHEIEPYKSMHFIEADVYFSLCLYITLQRLLNFPFKPLKSDEN